MARPDRGAPPVAFWFKLAYQTLRRREIGPLSAAMQDPFEAHGLEHLPEQGLFTLAANHTMQRWTPRLLASIHQATRLRRPELARDWLVIVGYREARLEGRPVLARWIIRRVRNFYSWMYRRWSYNTLRLPMGNDRSSIQALREWRERANRQPCIVFPEGRGAATFEEIRPGAGRWLATLGVPVVPVSVWWEEDRHRWQIVFGWPVRWSERSSLHDLQTGLEIAAGLPPEAAPDWQEALAHWRAAHDQPAVAPSVSLPVA